MNKKCKTCKKESSSLEKHHILPKSLGGTDCEDNLISICSNCHEKIHDVSFRGKNGLISKGVDRRKREINDARIWRIENKELEDNFFEDLEKNDWDKYVLLSYLLNYNNARIDHLDIKKMVLGVPVKVNLTL